MDREGGIPRRRFLGYLIAAPTLMAGAPFGARAFTQPAAGRIPTHQPVDEYDLMDLLTDAATPTSHMVTVAVHPDGSASFALPRAEVGQGITTAVAMAIADEMDLPLERVSVTLADARPELVWNQLTGGSNTMHSMFTPVRIAAAIARGRLLQAAADVLGGAPSDLTARDGVITAPDGRTVTFGSLAERAAASTTRRVTARLKPPSELRLVGTPQPRVDGLDLVTGRTRFAMDLDVPGAMPTMVCRPPTINGRVRSLLNQRDVEAMPGITDVVVVPTGVAVRGRTFGQCSDAVNALSVDWGPGTVDGKSDQDVLRDLRTAEIPLGPRVDPLATSVEQLFTFHFRPGAPLETNCAVADVRPDSAEIWASLQAPIWAQEQLAKDLGLPPEKVTVHVVQGGGAFGRHFFIDAALEAAAISQRLGKPVKLMWRGTDNFRHGRMHPMCLSRVRLTHSAGTVLGFDQRHTSVATDFSHGLGELLTATYASAVAPNGRTYSQTYFNLSANVPYDFGPVTQTLNEIYDYDTFHTSSVRNVFNPDVITATELMVDQVAAAMGKDPYRFRQEFIRDDRMRAVLDEAAKVGRWGRPMPPGTAQGIAIHNEYKGRSACLVEIDCTPATVNRHLLNAYTGPRVTKAVYVVDVGLPINPLGLQAQMMGGVMDGIAQALTYSLHLKDGAFVEGGWGSAHYSRHWNTPLELEVVVMPPTTGEPGGAGEFGAASSMAAVACAYARATGVMPTNFPINHDRP